MTLISAVFHAAPMVMPAPGFVARFEERLAYRLEQRRRSMIWLLLGIGVIALTIAALPSIMGAVWFTGRLVLPYEIVVYLQGLFDWIAIVLTTLADAARLLIRHSITQPVGVAFIGSAVAMGLLTLIWTRLLMGRLATQKTRA
jgi:membrane glycosyltransferase